MRSPVTIGGVKNGASGAITATGSVMIKASLIVASIASVTPDESHAQEPPGEARSSFPELDRRPGAGRTSSRTCGQSGYGACSVRNGMEGPMVSDRPACGRGDRPGVGRKSEARLPDNLTTTAGPAVGSCSQTRASTAVRSRRWCIGALTD